MINPTVHEMKAEIFRRGPISCSIDCSSVTHGRYKPGDIVTTTIPLSGEWDLDHVISVAGWGYDDKTGLEYWVVRNSWGTFWGDQGWFKVALGNNTLGIESECNWAVVDPIPIRANYGPSDIEREFASQSEPPTHGEMKFASKFFGFIENPTEVVPQQPTQTNDMHQTLVDLRRPKLPENEL
jgi:cathepsin X